MDLRLNFNLIVRPCPPHRNPHVLQLIEYTPGSGGLTGASEGVKAP